MKLAKKQEENSHRLGKMESMKMRTWEEDIMVFSFLQRIIKDSFSGVY